MAVKRIPLENVEEKPEALILRFPTELRELKKTSKQYEGTPSFSLSAYRNIQERQYQEQLGETA
jgi:hypothetical protein